MLNGVREVLKGAIRDLLFSWRSLAITDLGYKAISFALLTPGITWLLYSMRSGTSSKVLADSDILRFFVTTPIGIITLLLGGTLILAIVALEAACLTAIGIAAVDGVRLTARTALVFAAKRALNVLRLTGNMVVRLAAGLLPFLLAAGATYFALLRKYDINYYLARRPLSFWIAVGVVGVLAAALIALLLWTVGRWALALPLVLFEGVSPRRAIGESARRTIGDRRRVLSVLAIWAVAALALGAAATKAPELLGRVAAPRIGESLPMLLLFIALLAFLWCMLVLAAGVVNFSLFSLLLTRLYLQADSGRSLHRPVFAVSEGPAPLSGRIRLGLAIAVFLLCLGFALLAFLVTRENRPVLVIAHRGASAAAPENSLAAFRLAVEQGADFVELDVQESADGQVLVAHDADLMKLADFSGKIWETDAAKLRSVDIGSRKSAEFSGERVPTLAEALAVCKGRTGVVIELKSYGHNQKLEERVAAIVEAAGMQDHCVFMSLDHAMVRKMKQLRPAWRCGILVAAARGDLTSLGADFLAVEARMASPRFVRRAHRAGQDVYVWTVNDPAWMLTTMSRGVDGLITDKPDVARQVVARRAEMSDGQRFLVALLVRVGARTEALERLDALRP